MSHAHGNLELVDELKPSLSVKGPKCAVRRGKGPKHFFRPEDGVWRCSTCGEVKPSTVAQTAAVLDAVRLEREAAS